MPCMQLSTLSEQQVRLRLYGERSETVRRLGGAFRRALRPDAIAQPQPQPPAAQPGDADDLTHAA
jgi:hypothetical protein